MTDLRLGIDLGGTHIKLAMVTAQGQVRGLQKVDTPRSPKEVVERLKDALSLWREYQFSGTGVGVAGDVDPIKGIVRFAPNLGWKNVPIKKMLRNAGFPAPLHVDNDANAAAWGVYQVELKQHGEQLIVLTLGTGVGGGLVFGGKLYHGATGSAGELGHVTIDPKGPLCGCGNRGCLETYLGGVHIIRRAREEAARRGRRLPEPLTPLELDKMAGRGDRLAKYIWRQAGTALGIGLASLVNVLNPDMIVFCGGVANAGRHFLPPAREEIRRRAFRTPRSAVRLRIARANDFLGVVGAALLVP